MGFEENFWRILKNLPEFPLDPLILWLRSKNPAEEDYINKYFAISVGAHRLALSQALPEVFSLLGKYVGSSQDVGKVFRFFPA